MAAVPVHIYVYACSVYFLYHAQMLTGYVKQFFKMVILELYDELVGPHVAVY